MHPHPASLILLWLAFLLLASAHAGTLLLQLCAISVFCALLFSRTHLRQLLRRSRWLLLMLVLLFGGMTPGTPLDYLPGATLEGLQLAAEHAARLILALAALALVLNALRPVELVAGMRTLLAPLAAMGLPRDKLAVRLALTLEEVEHERGQGATETTVTTATTMGDVLLLPQATWGRADAGLGLLAVVVVVGFLWC
jgi:energy-coupling factor transporter transmembrane protein EcfT